MRRFTALLVLVVLAVAGCGTTDHAGEADGGAASGAEKTTAGAGAQADLGFTATTLEGEEFSGSSLVGRPTVLWFWAPWCPTCRAQIPTVSGLGDRYGGRVNVVGVGGLDTQDEIAELAGSIEQVTHLVDAEGTVWEHFGVTAQSTYTVLDADGRIVHEGYLDNGDLEDLVADLTD